MGADILSERGAGREERVSSNEPAHSVVARSETLVKRKRIFLSRGIWWVAS